MSICPQTQCIHACGMCLHLHANHACLTLVASPHIVAYDATQVNDATVAADDKLAQDDASCSTTMEAALQDRLRKDRGHWACRIRRVSWRRCTCARWASRCVASVSRCSTLQYWWLLVGAICSCSHILRSVSANDVLLVRVGIFNTH